MLVHALAEEVVFTSDLKLFISELELFTEFETKQEAELAAAEPWSRRFVKIYKPSDPSEPWSKISLAPCDFTRQWLGWNSKNTPLSSANLPTLIGFLVIVGTCKCWFKDKDTLGLIGETKVEEPVELMGKPCPLPM